MHFQEYGHGDPVIALHPLALESTAFAGVGRQLAGRGLRTLAVDLPGFGRTEAPPGPLTPAVLAAPVIDLAHRLAREGARAPLLLGMSLGGRVALEAAFTAPELFRGAVLVAPYLPWRSRRWALRGAKLLSPAAAERIPLERAWPVLRALARTLESRPKLQDDWLARASVRVIYYWSCAATRSAFVSAARELALDPAYGRRGTWTRLAALEPPAAFLWCGRDALIPSSHARDVARCLPSAHQLEIGCSGHFVHGRHFRCFNHAVAQAVALVDDAAPPLPPPAARQPGTTVACACIADEPARAADAPGLAT